MVVKWTKYNKDTTGAVEPLDKVRLSRTALMLKEACRNPKNYAEGQLCELYAGYIGEAINGKVDRPHSFSQLPHSNYEREHELDEGFMTTLTAFRAALQSKPQWITKTKERFMENMRDYERAERGETDLKTMKFESGQWYILEEYEE